MEVAVEAAGDKLDKEIRQVPEDLRWKQAFIGRGRGMARPQKEMGGVGHGTGGKLNVTNGSVGRNQRPENLDWRFFD